MAETMREILTSLFSPEARAAVAGGDAARIPALWRQAAESGLFGLRVTEALGGLGLEWDATLAVMSECGRVLLPGPWADQVGYLPALLAEAPAAAAAGVAGALVAGELVAVRPSRVGGLSARPAGDGGWCLTGRWLQPYATLGATALLPLPDAGVALLAGDLAMADLVPGAPLDPLVPTAWVTVRDRIVAADAVLPLTPAVHAAATTAAALVTGAYLTGVAAALLEQTLSHVKQREQFGRPLGSFQAAKHQVVDMYLELELMRSSLEAAVAPALPAAERAALVDTVARSFPRRCRRVAEKAFHLHGAMAFAWETGLHLFLRAAKAHELAAAVSPEVSV